MPAISDDAAGTWTFTLTDKPECAIVHHKHDGKVFINDEAQLLMKRKMIELRYIHSGLGPSGPKAKILWYEFLADFGIRGSMAGERVKKDVFLAISSFVTAMSQVWSKKRIWSNEPAGKVTFCRFCPAPKAPDDGDGHDVVFMQEAVELAKKDEWNGEFEDSRAMCFDHATKVLEHSKEEWSVNGVAEVKAELDILLLNSFCDA